MNLAIFGGFVVTMSFY